MTAIESLYPVYCKANMICSFEHVQKQLAAVQSSVLAGAKLLLLLVENVAMVMQIGVTEHDVLGTDNLIVLTQRGPCQPQRWCILY